MNQLVIEVDGIKNINSEFVKEEYGEELTNELLNRANYCLKENMDWKLEVIDENYHFVTFAFATRSYSYVYEISKKRKYISQKDFIGYSDAEAVLELMDGIRK